MARYNSLAASNRKHRKFVSTKHSGRKRSDYVRKKDGPLVSAITAFGDLTETAIGSENLIKATDTFEFVRIIMGAHQSSGLRSCEDGEIIIYVESGKVTLQVLDAELQERSGVAAGYAGSSFMIPENTTWAISGGDQGAALMVCRTKDYEGDIKQLSEPVSGEAVKITTPKQDVLQAGINLPARDPRRRSKEEREVIAASMGQIKKITERKRNSKKEETPRSAQETLPSSGSVVEDPKTGAKYVVRGPQPVDDSVLERMAMEGQPTRAPLHDGVERAAYPSPYHAKQAEIQTRVNNGET